MKASKLALGVLGGIATGVTLGILFAPAKGADTRKKILKKGNNIAHEFKDKLGNLSEEIKSSYAKMFQNDKDLIVDGKSKFDDNKDEIKSGSV